MFRDGFLKFLCTVLRPLPAKFHLSTSRLFILSSLRSRFVRLQLMDCRDRSGDDEKEKKETSLNGAAPYKRRPMKRSSGPPSYRNYGRINGTNHCPRWSSFTGIETAARIEQKRNDFPTSPDVHGLIGCYVFYEVSGHPTPEPRKIHPPHGPHQPIAVDPEEGRRRRCGRVRTTIQAATTRL